jgi:hypothetical protein
VAKLTQILKDGHRTTISIPGAGTNLQAVFLEVKRVKPFGLDQRGGIDTTSMLNDTHVTEEPKKLKAVTPLTLMCSYGGSRTLAALNALMGLILEITVNWPDGQVTRVQGFINTVEPQEVSEGEQPMVSVEIRAANVLPGALSSQQGNTERVPQYT